MTLFKVSVISESGQTFEFPLQDMSAGYYVADIQGLDPVKAALAMSKFGSADGAQYQGSRRESRNVVIDLGYNPDYVTNSVASLRAALYAAMIPKAEVKLRFHHTEGLVVGATGRVESFESPLFVRTPKSTISILCGDPDFYDINETSVPLNTVSGTTESEIVYQGDVWSGFRIEVAVNRSIAGLDFTHRGPDNVINPISLVYSLIAGDQVVISTVPGNKGAWLTRASETSSILYGIDPSSSWPRFRNGINYVRLQVAGAAIPYAIKYTTKYGGL